MNIKDLFQNLLQLLFPYVKIHLQIQRILLLGTVHKAQILRNDLIENKTSHCGFHNSALYGTIPHLLFHPSLNAGVKRYHPILIGKNRLIHTLKGFALALASRPLLGQIIDPQHHILRRDCHQTSVRRL